MIKHNTLSKEQIIQSISKEAQTKEIPMDISTTIKLQ